MISGVSSKWSVHSSRRRVELKKVAYLQKNMRQMYSRYYMDLDETNSTETPGGEARRILVEAANTVAGRVLEDMRLNATE